MKNLTQAWSPELQIGAKNCETVLLAVIQISCCHESVWDTFICNDLAKNLGEATPVIKLKVGMETFWPTNQGYHTMNIRRSESKTHTEILMIGATSSMMESL